MSFNSTIFILPGLGNSDEQHWQSIWEKENPAFIRINQQDWEMPHCSDWIAVVDQHIQQYKPEQVIVVGHNLACVTVACWAEKYQRKVKGALLVAPSDVEADTYPPGTTGFEPMTLNPLSFPSIVVASSNDYYVTPDRAAYFARQWGSDLINIGEAGHINVAAGFGPWDFGLTLLKKLDN
jgi:hypothetical protein